jgi:hypothetical protein
MNSTNTPNLWEIRKAVKPFLTSPTQNILFFFSQVAQIQWH